MKIGLDFDNTIVNYDALFHKVALEKKLIHKNVPKKKLAVRDYLKTSNQETSWTEIQGYVYGARLDEAISYPGVLSFLRESSRLGHRIIIISHKTQYPFLGPQYDLHEAARSWIKSHLVKNGKELVLEKDIFFEPTKEKKISRIKEMLCDLFVDDLPEILSIESFPKLTRRFLFDPDGIHTGDILSEVTILSSWMELSNYTR